MNYQSILTEFTKSPPVYDLKLKIGDIVEFNHRIIFNASDIDFSELIAAVKEKKNYKCTYNTYGTLTEYIVLDSREGNTLKDKFVINHYNAGSASRITFDLTKDHEFIVEHINNLQEGLLRCKSLGKNLTNELKDYIQANQNACFAMTLLQDKSISAIDHIYNKRDPVIVIDDKIKESEEEETTDD